MKVTIVGAGFCGAATMQRVAEADVAEELVVVDSIDGRAEGLALDMMQNRPISRFDTRVVGSTGYEMTAGSDVCVIAAGLTRQPGMARIDLLRANAEILRDITFELVTRSPDAVLIVVTDPLDEMTTLAALISEFPKHRVIGQAGMVNSARFAHFVAEHFGVSPLEVDAATLGSHEEAMVPVSSQVWVSGARLTDIADADTIRELVRRTQAGAAQIGGLLKGGSAYYAPSAAAAAMVKAVVRDTGQVMPACAWLSGQYGITGVFLSVPARLGSCGVKEIVELPLSAHEATALREAADTVRRSTRSIQQYAATTTVQTR